MRTLEYYLSKAQIVNNDTKYLRTRSDLLAEISQRLGDYQTNDLSEALYLLRNGLTSPPECEVCKARLTSKSFVNGLKGYRRWCGKSCYKLSPSWKDSIKATSIEKYGTDHPLASKLVQEKRKATNLKKYGDQNPMKWSGEKFREAMYNRYGAENSRYVDEINEKIILSIADRNERIFSNKLIDHLDALEIKPVDQANLLLHDRDSQVEWIHSCGQRFFCSLEKIYKISCPTCHRPKNLSNFQFEVEEFVRQHTSCKIWRNNRTRIAPYEIDVLIEDLNLGIELHGDYWHSDIYVDFNYHQLKADSCGNLKLIQIFESEWINKRPIVESILKVNLKAINHTEFARKLELISVSSEDEIEFFNKNHLQGYARSDVCLGLVNETGELITCMSFGRPRFSKEADWELIRYAAKLNTVVIGGASKLLANFKLQFPHQSILTYADRRISNGHLYRILGFTEVGKTSPNYWYVNFKTGQRLSRYQAQKKKLPKILGEGYIESLTEVENMRLNGFHQIADAGNFKFIFEPNLS